MSPISRTANKWETRCGFLLDQVTASTALAKHVKEERILTLHASYSIADHKSRSELRARARETIIYTCFSTSIYTAYNTLCHSRWGVSAEPQQSQLGFFGPFFYFFNSQNLLQRHQQLKQISWSRLTGFVHTRGVSSPKLASIINKTWRLLFILLLKGRITRKEYTQVGFNLGEESECELRDAAGHYEYHTSSIYNMDFGCEDGRFSVSASCVTIWNPDSLSNSIKG